jgi:hypothetical protein
MNRVIAKQIRELRWQAFDPISFRNARLGVRASVFAIGLFFVGGMTCLGGLQLFGIKETPTLVGVYFEACAAIACVSFLICRWRRTQQGKRLDADLERVVRAALAEGDERVMAEAA